MTYSATQSMHSATERWYRVLSLYNDLRKVSRPTYVERHKASCVPGVGAGIGRVGFGTRRSPLGRESPKKAQVERLLGGH